METYDGIHTIYSGDVQYPYAEVGGPKLLHISSVTPENRRSYNYECPCCHKRLRPRIGNKNRHCFSHDKGSRCAMDKYIHGTAERLLKEKFDSDEPFEVEMSVRKQCSLFDECIFKSKYNPISCKSGEPKKFNMKDYYDECLVEKKIGEFVPDLTLIDSTGKHDPIFIEIWYKHKSKETKLNSGNQVIEIRLNNVDDLEALSKEPVRESDTVHFFNFKTRTFVPDEGQRQKLYKFALYPSRKSYLTPTNEIFCTDYLEHHYKTSIIEITASLFGYYDTNELWQYCLYLCRSKGFDVKDCYMCKHCRRNREIEDGDKRTVYCRKLSTKEYTHVCEHDYGKGCDAFEEVEGRLLQLKRKFINARLYIWVSENAQK